MFFRSERHIVAEGKADAFSAFFVRQLLPIREKYGARLVGRWQTDDEVEVLSIWAYESREAAEEIDELVNGDRATAEAQEFQERYLEPLYHEQVETPLYSTVPLEQTALGTLAFPPPVRR
ncbi:MAG TPA: hypothetical protein VE287_05270 [Actinopolymorphaceae bacterium]|nr:hypothetical protein [Actinopolymorphaceae bacterium]